MVQSCCIHRASYQGCTQFDFCVCMKLEQNLKMLPAQHRLFLRRSLVVVWHFVLLVTETSSLKPEEKHPSQPTGEYFDWCRGSLHLTRGIVLSLQSFIQVCGLEKKMTEIKGQGQAKVYLAVGLKITVCTFPTAWISLHLV